MRISLIGWTHFQAPTYIPWIADETAQPGENIIEFAGRNCYQSWHKPNVDTAANADYIRNIIKSGHGSVLEHATLTFYIDDISRSLTHELIRHRHLSFSELSQRFCQLSETKPVIPPLFDGLMQATKFITDAYNDALDMYSRLQSQPAARGATRKEKLEAARAVMPNATPTAIVVTGNVRAWHSFMAQRGAQAADAEIRQLAVRIYQYILSFWPNVVCNFVEKKDIHGSAYLEVIDL